MIERDMLDRRFLKVLNRIELSPRELRLWINTLDPLREIKNLIE